MTQNTGVTDLIVPLQRVSQPHHYFGYYEKCPWDATGRYLLANEVGFEDRQPEPGETMRVGLIDLHDSCRFTAFDETTEWSWQQGTMLQWLGSDPSRLVVYNRLTDGQPSAVVRDVFAGDLRALDRPVYAVSPDGQTGLSLDFYRLHHLRPGYGYVATRPEPPIRPIPDDQGIYHVDMRTGRSQLLLSIRQVAHFKPAGVELSQPQWVNHLQINRSGTRFAFLHRWSTADGKFATRLMTCDFTGSDLRVLGGAEEWSQFSHYDWRDDHAMLMWAVRRADRKRAFFLFDDRDGSAEPIGEEVMLVDGHCSYSPDRQWVLNDTYPDKRDHHRTLYMFRTADGRRIDLGRLYSPPELDGPVRVDLHPRWNRDGTQVCIDSAHEGTRHMYVLNVAAITRS